MKKARTLIQKIQRDGLSMPGTFGGPLRCSGHGGAGCGASSAPVTSSGSSTAALQRSRSAVTSRCAISAWPASVRGSGCHAPSTSRGSATIAWRGAGSLCRSAVRRRRSPSAPSRRSAWALSARRATSDMAATASSARPASSSSNSCSASVRTSTHEASRASPRTHSSSTRSTPGPRSMPTVARPCGSFDARLAVCLAARRRSAASRRTARMPRRMSASPPQAADRNRTAAATPEADVSGSSSPRSIPSASTTPITAPATPIVASRMPATVNSRHQNMPPRLDTVSGSSVHPSSYSSRLVRPTCPSSSWRGTRRGSAASSRRYSSAAPSGSSGSNVSAMSVAVTSSAVPGQA